MAPDQLQQKNIDDVEKELAQEILFGLDPEYPGKAFFEALPSLR